MAVLICSEEEGSEPPNIPILFELQFLLSLMDGMELMDVDGNDCRRYHTKSGIIYKPQLVHSSFCATPHFFNLYTPTTN